MIKLASGVLAFAKLLPGRMGGRRLLLLALLALAIAGGLESYRAVRIVREVDRAQELL